MHISAAASGGVMMRINLYNNKADDRVVDKTDYITLVQTTDADIKGTCNITDPVLILDYAANNFNYVYIPDWHRYYRVINITVTAGNKTIITCEVDVLMSFKTDILNLKAYIVRNEFDYDLNIPDNLLPLQEKTIVYSRTDNAHAPGIGVGTIIMHVL